MRALVLLVLAYGIGSIPTDALLHRLAGIEGRRRDGSRVRGTLLGIVTAVANMQKGALPVLLAQWWSGDPAVAAATAVLVVVGGVFPWTHHFAGGEKGVTTAFGALCALCPRAALWALAVFLFAFGLDRYVSFASVLAALAAPVAIAIHAYPIESLAAALLMAAIIVTRHRENLSRLRAGTEPRFKLPKRQAPPSN